jgi:hypothetical protein
LRDHENQEDKNSCRRARTMRTARHNEINDKSQTRRGARDLSRVFSQSSHLAPRDERPCSRRADDDQTTRVFSGAPRTIDRLFRHRRGRARVPRTAELALECVEIITRSVMTTIL